jgi:hypothetical protein
MKTSPNGAVIMSGTGVAAVRKKLEEEFQKARGLVVSPKPQSQPQTPQEPRETVYTEQNKTQFHERANRLSRAALSSSQIPTHSRNGVWNIEAPSEIVEDLYKAALRRDENE